MPKTKIPVAPPPPSKKAKPPHNPDILEIFHNDRPICSVPAGGTRIPAPTFDSYRPPPRTFVDYSISQTEAKYDAGPTRLHLRSTAAAYVWKDHVRPLRGARFCSGGPPRRDVDDIWRAARQRAHVANLAEMWRRQRRKRVLDRLRNAQGHAELMRMVGPAWWQELSPQQVRTVDQLARAIRRDTIEHTTINVKENMAALGLVLRPNPRHLERALQECCQCPVEFLLILYQLWNPNRKKYTINDRLLLSSVAHLSMRATLRELHIRIPSPPKAIPKPQKKAKRAKKLTYDSPYLQPYDYIRAPEKYTGLYYNKHVQRPECPYFDYLPQLRSDLEQCKPRELDEFSEVEDELLLETLYAQKIYEDLVEFRPVQTLLIPTRYKMCFNFRNPEPKVEEDEEVEDDDGFSGDERSDEVVTKELVYVDLGENEEEEMDFESEEYIPDCCHLDREELSGSRNASVQEPPIVEQPPPSASSQDEEPLFACKAATFEYIEKPLCQCERCIEDRKRKEHFFEIRRQQKADWERFRREQELAHLEGEDRRDLLALIQEEEPQNEMQPVGEDTGSHHFACDCYEKFKKKIAAYEAYQKRLALILTQKKLQDRYLINGVVNTPDGPIYNIGGLAADYDCPCAIAHKKAEAERLFIENAPQIPKGRIRYQISGVHESPDGARHYIINDPIPMEPCDCMKMFTEFESKHEHCMDVYNDYLARANELLEEYREDMGEDFDEEDENQCQMLLEDRISEESALEAQENRDMEEEQDDNVKRKTCSEKNIETDEGFEELFVQGHAIESEGCCCGQVASQPVVEEEEEEEEEEEMEEGLPVCCQKPKPKKSKRKKQKCRNCKCKPPKRPIIKCCQKSSPCAIEYIEEEEVVEEEEEIVEEEEVKEPIVLKRFFIKDKLKCCTSWQRRVVRKALKSMAEDGYPLAKLPDAYKLPQFRLWMQMRCGLFWTKADADKYVLYSRHLWRHTDACYRAIITPKLPLTNEEARKYTWRSAYNVKKMTGDAKDWYYRRVRQQFVNLGREFFPTLFNYEFPFWTFRDCFFSYIPAKEEEVVAISLWQPHERHR